jgi:hypothetical protein
VPKIDSDNGQFNDTDTDNRYREQTNRNQSMEEDPMLKTILAGVLAGAFLVSVPAWAEDKAPEGDKAEKAKKDKAGKTEKKDKAEKAEKPAGGW